MKAVLCGNGSVPVCSCESSPRPSLIRHASVSPGFFSGDRSSAVAGSPRISLHLEINPRGCGGSSRSDAAPIRRALSETDLMRSGAAEFRRGLSNLSGSGSRSFSAGIPEVDEEGTFGYAGAWPASGISMEELGFSGHGLGKGKRCDGAGNGGGDCDASEIGDYYKEMLKSNPGDSLLLRNYGKYLQEVEGDLERAEEYYGRAILASPGDGEVLSLYGKLIWDTKRDGERAKAYFERAVFAAPDDCMVLGSYANFLWEAEEDEEGEVTRKEEVSPVVVAAF